MHLLVDQWLSLTVRLVVQVSFPSTKYLHYTFDDLSLHKLLFNRISLIFFVGLPIIYDFTVCLDILTLNKTQNPGPTTVYSQLT